MSAETYSYNFSSSQSFLDGDAVSRGWELWYIVIDVLDLYSDLYTARLGIVYTSLHSNHLKPMTSILHNLIILVMFKYIPLKLAKDIIIKNCEMIPILYCM